MIDGVGIENISSGPQNQIQDHQSTDRPPFPKLTPILPWINHEHDRGYQDTVGQAQERKCRREPNSAEPRFEKSILHAPPPPHTPIIAPPSQLSPPRTFQ